MLNDRWSLLEEILKQPDGLKELDDITMAAIADRLEGAISASNRAPLQVLSAQLIAVFNKFLRAVPPEVSNQIRGGYSMDSVIGSSYLLGQIGFAQRVAAEAFEKRADDEFVQIVLDGRFTKYINALFDEERTGVELASIVKVCAETVSRNLKKLRELGVTDFRREGTTLLNFLTPAAESILKEVKKNSSRITMRSEVKSLLEGIPNYLQAPMNFSQEPKAA